MVTPAGTTFPSLSLYNIVVLPAISRPTINMPISFLAHKPPKSLVNGKPILFPSISAAARNNISQIRLSSQKIPKF